MKHAPHVGYASAESGTGDLAEVATTLQVSGGLQAAGEVTTPDGLLRVRLLNGGVRFTWWHGSGVSYPGFLGYRAACLKVLEEVRQRYDGPQLTRCEVAQVRHLRAGAHWKDHRDLQRLFHAWSGEQAFPAVQVGFSVRFSLPVGAGEEGTLDVLVAPGLAREDRTPMFVLKSVAQTTCPFQDPRRLISRCYAWASLGQSHVRRQSGC